MASSSGEEHDVRYIIRLCKDTMREDAIEFGNPLATLRAPTQQELKIPVPLAAYNAGHIDKVAHIDECEEESRKWRVYPRNVCKYRASVSKAASSKDDNRF